MGVFFKVTGSLLILVAAGLLAYGEAEFQEAGLLPEVFPLWNVSGAPVVGEGAPVSELLTAFIAWASYLLVVGFAFLRPQPLAEGAASPAARNTWRYYSSEACGGPLRVLKIAAIEVPDRRISAACTYTVSTSEAPA